MSHNVSAPYAPLCILMLQDMISHTLINRKQTRTFFGSFCKIILSSLKLWQINHAATQIVLVIDHQDKAIYMHKRERVTTDHHGTQLLNRNWE
uniref:Uncharacterized protein n=1 Tax=Anguilla anguilla TaxID=7936 RepID=A0A0E9PUD4_ANGAN